MNRKTKNLDAGPTITQRQCWVMLLAAALLIILLSVIFFQERNKELQLRAEQTSHRLALVEEIVARDIDRVQADLRFVAVLPEVIAADAGNAIALRKVTQVFTDFVTSQQTYSQVRLIGRNGMEIARVDWDGQIATATPNSELQDKSDRYYVSESLALKPGQIFTSEFDLNLENGKIERPLKPVIRFVIPISQNGSSGNLLVFNYQGAALLEELAAISLPGKTFLVREDGEFLLGPGSEFEWGWLLNHTKNFTSLFNDVRIMNLIKSDEVIKTKSGLFQAREIQFGRDKVAMAEAQTSLFGVAYIESTTALESSSKLLNRLMLVGGIMLIPLGLITRFWAAAIDRRELQNRKIAESEQRLRQLSAQLIGLQEDERKNLSREIHDSLGQQATAINLELRMLKGKLSSSPELERLIGESDELLRSLHGFATRVRPAELDDLGLQVALESHVLEFAERTGIEAELSVVDVDTELDSSIAAHIFRIVQESLNNIAKHAEATVASVKLQMDLTNGRLNLEVSDDGIGMSMDSTFPDRRSHGKRLGMIGVRERVDLLNGTIDLTSSVGMGTILRIEIPMPESKKEPIEAIQ
ncbi:MAG: ATP-binding protein [Planctomycetota bacterium]